jgi:putative ABC transport system permease protein
MNLVTIAWKSVRQRWLASALTCLSVSLGVALMVTVLVINGVVTRMFNQSATGFHLIVGAKGSPMQLVLNTIYFLDRPIENLPYKYYLELSKLSSVNQAIPFNLGDTTADGRFRIVGTIPRFFELEYVPGRYLELQGGRFLAEPFEAVIGARVARAYGWKVGHEFPIAHGGNVDDVHAEQFKIAGILRPTGTPIDRAVFVHIDGFFLIPGHEKPLEEARIRDEALSSDEAPIVMPTKSRGANAAQPPQRQAPANGEPQKQAPGAEGRGGAAQPNVSQARPNGNGAAATTKSLAARARTIPDEQKEVTAILLQMKSELLAALMQPRINKAPVAQAVNPIQQISQLLRDVVGNIRMMLVVMTSLIIIVSGVGIFVSIYNSMADRKREIAVMRALGARRLTVFSIIITEAVLICVGGGVLGLLLGHGLVFAATPIVEAKSDLYINPWSFDHWELVLLPALVALAAIVGVVPAASAYRADVARGLQD